MTEYKLTYFNLRGRAEPIRMIFAYAGVKYEDNRIEREHWLEHKANYPWGQVPVLQIGDKVLCQSDTIGRYLAKKYDLAGENDWEAAKIDEFIDALAELSDGWRNYFMEQDETKKAELKKVFVETTMPKYYSNFEAQLNSNGGVYMVGKKVSWLDFKMASFLDFFEVQEPGVLENYPGLKKLMQTVSEIPQIKEWIAKRPVTPF